MGRPPAGARVTPKRQPWPPELQGVQKGRRRKPRAHSPREHIMTRFPEQRIIRAPLTAFACAGEVTYG